MKIENIVYGLVVVAVLLLGMYIGKVYMPNTEYVEKPILVHEPDLKVVYVNRTIEVPKIEYVNRTVVKEVPVVEYKTKTVEVIKEPTDDFRNMILEYLKVNFTECDGFNLSGFDESEISLFDLNELSFKVSYDDEDNHLPEFSEINANVEYKYKAEDLPREYHQYNVTINYDNDDEEIVNCSMVQLS